jgi:hypothetical protein
MVIASGATPISSDAPEVPGPHGDTAGTRAVDTAGTASVLAPFGAAEPHADATSATATSAPKTRLRPRVARDVPISDPYLPSPALVLGREIRLEWHSERRILTLKPDNRKRDAQWRTRNVVNGAGCGARHAPWCP